MKSFLAWLTGAIAGPVFAGLFVAATVLALWQTARIEGFWFIDGLKGVVAALNAEIDDPLTGWKKRLKDEQAKSKTLDDGLTACNASVDYWKRESDRRSAASQLEVDKGRKDLAAAKAQIAAMKRMPLPGETTCASIHRYLSEEP